MVKNQTNTIFKPAYKDDSMLVKLEQERNIFFRWNDIFKKFMYMLIINAGIFFIVIYTLTGYNNILQASIAANIVFYLLINAYFIWKRERVIMTLTRVILEEKIRKEMEKTGRRV